MKPIEKISTFAEWSPLAQQFYRGMLESYVNGSVVVNPAQQAMAQEIYNAALQDRIPRVTAEHPCMTKPSADRQTIDALRSVLRQMIENARNALMDHRHGAERNTLVEIWDVAQKALEATETGGTAQTTPDGPAARCGAS